MGCNIATCPSNCLAGIFGAKGLKADVLSSFTVKALQPIVWTRLAQACEWKSNPQSCGASAAHSR